MNLNRKFFQGLAALALATVALGAHAGTAAYYIYDEDGHVIGEYKTDGTPIQEHVYLDNRPVAVLQNGSTDYVSTDQLDTPRIITDSSKNVVWQWNSDPYGNGQSAGSLSYNLRFPGQYFDAETGKNYNYYRDYNPATGRYVESDPIGLAGGINTYAYADNNSLGNVDPTGLAVYVGEHGALFPGDPLQHTAIVLEPDNPGDFNFPNNMSTIGAQPSGIPNLQSAYGNLQSAPNNPGDSPGTDCKPGPLKNLTLVSTPAGMTDTQFIQALLNAANSYKNNSPYLFFPYWYYYNSNSYTAGVIIAAGGTPPSLPGSQPGYNHPLPLP